MKDQMPSAFPHVTASGDEDAQPRFWYFTFGYGHRLYVASRDTMPDGEGIDIDGGYVKLYGTFSAAREYMVKLFGKRWSFQYEDLPIVPGYRWFDLTPLLIRQAQLENIGATGTATIQISEGQRIALKALQDKSPETFNKLMDSILDGVRKEIEGMM